MHKNFANEIINYFEFKGYEVTNWISKEKGGDTVETDALDLIKAGESIINGTWDSTSSANYRAIYLQGNEDDGGDEVILCKNYIVVKFPCRNNE